MTSRCEGHTLSHMPRTTLMIADDLLRQLKQKAVEEGRTLQEVTNDLLRHALRLPKRSPYKLRWQGWDADIQPGVDLLDRDKLFDLMDGR